MPNFFSRVRVPALTGLLALLLMATAPPAIAHDANYSQEWQDARDASFYGDQGSPPSWGTVDRNNNNPAGFYTPEPQFFSANNRLANEQTGDRGLRWAVAGPKDYDARRFYNAYLPEEERPSTPRSAFQQYEQMYRDLQAACLRGDTPSRCFEIYGTQQEIMYSYFGNALDYRRNGYGLPGSYTANWMWTVYLEDANGGLSWSNGSGQPGSPRPNYGRVATVGEMRGFLLAEAQNTSASEAYRYNMARAAVYLDYLYGNDLSHPIELLTIPDNWWFVCSTPRMNPDGTVFRDFYGDPIMEVRRPIVLASPFARDAATRAMSCPPVTNGRWEYSYESEIRGDSSQTVVDLTAPYAIWTEVTDQSPVGVGRVPFTTQSERKLTPFGITLEEVCETRGGCPAGTTFTDAELQQLEAAAEDSQDATGPKLDLTSSNRQALAEGRLILVAEHAQDARITKREQRDRYMRRWIETRTYYDENGTVVSMSTHTSPWEYANEPDRDITVGEATFTYGQRHFTGGFQALTTHCNQTGFDSTVGTRSIDERTTTNAAVTGTYLAGSAVSPAFTDPSDRPWGVEGPTSELGFYDKVCSFQGTRTDVETGDATSRQLPSSLTGFRTNEWKELPVAYYTPTSDGWVDYQGDGSVGFTATRWEGGTPVPGQFWIGSQDCVTGTMSDGYFGTSTSSVPTLRQWVHNDYSSPTVAIGEGCYDRIFTRGVWASLTRKPQVLTVKWDFMPEVDTVIPATNIGLSLDRRATYDKEVIGARVRGQVLSSHEAGRTTVDARQQAYEQATGTGSTNTLDTPTPYGTSLDSSGAWNVSPDAFDPHYYALKLVRAVGQ